MSTKYKATDIDVAYYLTIITVGCIDIYKNKAKVYSC